MFDFVFQKTNGRYQAVELEPPNVSPFIGSDEFSKRFDHAIDQVEQWKLGAQKYPKLMEDTLGMVDVYPPDGMVVIGRSADIKTPKRRERWHDRCAHSPHRLYTWDDIIARGKSLGERLGNPRLSPIDWS